MELSQEFLIDMAINAAGYLLVGIISIVCYALMKKKKTTTAFEEVVTDEQTLMESLESQTHVSSSESKKVEFIAFGQEQVQPEQAQHEIAQRKQRQENVIDTSGRMSRKEAINIAKKMLLAGATHEKIKRILPVSESELALLSLNNK